MDPAHLTVVGDIYSGTIRIERQGSTDPSQSTAGIGSVHAQEVEPPPADEFTEESVRALWASGRRWEEFKGDLPFNSHKYFAWLTCRVFELILAKQENFTEEEVHASKGFLMELHLSGMLAQYRQDNPDAPKELLESLTVQDLWPYAMDHLFRSSDLPEDLYWAFNAIGEPQAPSHIVQKIVGAMNQMASQWLWECPSPTLSTSESAAETASTSADPQVEAPGQPKRSAGKRAEVVSPGLKDLGLKLVKGAANVAREVLTPPTEEELARRQRSDEVARRSDLLEKAEMARLRAQRAAAKNPRGAWADCFDQH